MKIEKIGKVKVSSENLYCKSVLSASTDSIRTSDTDVLYSEEKW